ILIYNRINTMFPRIFGKPKQEANAVTTLDKLNETLEMLEKKEKVLLKKAAAEVEKAKEYTKAKNKRGIASNLACSRFGWSLNPHCYVTAAIQCLKRKRLYEQQLSSLETSITYPRPGAKATTETVDALRSGAAAMKSMQKATLGTELEELESAELEEELLQPATTAPAAPVHAPAGKQPARAAPQKRTAEEDELAALQAEMAL
ncbi:hypothetical protein C3L33_03587, partial [Rhododendron williamsianum]